MPSTSNDIFTRLSPDVASFLFRLGTYARALEVQAFLVGGGVRDVLLGRNLVDLDVMIVGDAPEFVQKVRKNWEELFPLNPSPGKAIIFKKYGTAKLPFAAPLWGQFDVVDFSSARTESYPEPGQRPVVERGTLRDDLFRRDFTVNALAVSLMPIEQGMVVDFFGGLQDLRSRQLRVLHEKSFLDDPARLLRAVRLRTRLGFSLEACTAELFRAAVTVRALCTLPAQRLWDELRKVLQEENSELVLDELQQCALLAQFSPALCWDRASYSGNVSSHSDALRSWERLLGYFVHRFSASDRHRVYEYVKLGERSGDVEQWCEYLRRLYAC